MTDEQLDRLEQQLVDLGEYGRFKWLAPLREMLADYRRLRELDRACRALWCEHRQDGTRCMASPIIRYSKEQTRQLDAAIAAIGRLLEGER